MAVIWASVIAVVGTLGGVTASYLLQERSNKRNELKARSEQLRHERLAAYSTFAGAVMDLRGAQYDRGNSRMTDAGRQSDRSSIRAESSRLRSVAWTAFYRFKLTSPNQELTDLGRKAVEEALDVADASDKGDLKDRSERARERIDKFTKAAVTQLEAGDAVLHAAKQRDLSLQFWRSMRTELRVSPTADGLHAAWRAFRRLVDERNRRGHACDH